MKIMNIALLSVALIAALTFQTDTFAGTVGQAMPIVRSTATTSDNADSVINTEREKVEQAIIDTETIKTAATLAINKAREQLVNDEISAVEAAKIIGEQSYKIEQAEMRLAELVKQSVEEVEAAEAQASYMSQFISGAQSIGARALAPFRAGYGYTEQEKGIARAIIAELSKALEQIGKEYAIRMQAASEEVGIRAIQAFELLRRNEWNQIKQELENEIYQQQLITGDAMSTNRKLFWGAVGLAGAVVGGTLAKQYLGTQDLSTQVPAEDERSLAEQALEKLTKTEQLRAPEEQPFGGSMEIESALQQGEKSLAEKGADLISKELAKLPTETQEEYRTRIEEAQGIWSRSAESSAEARKQLQERPRRSAEEQREVVSEVGREISEKAGATGGRLVDAPQYRAIDEPRSGQEKEENDDALAAKVQNLKELARKQLEKIDKSDLSEKIIINEPKEPSYLD